MSAVILHVIARTPRGKLSAGTLCGRWARGLLTTEERDIGQPWRLCRNCERAA